MYRFALITTFALLTASTCEAETGLASYYGGRGHHGEMTCAHRTRPFRKHGDGLTRGPLHTLPRQ